MKVMPPAVFILAIKQTTYMITRINILRLTDEKHQQLLSAARLLKQSKNIRFNIQRVTNLIVYIEVTQGYHISENFASDSTLDEYAKELFKDYVDGRTILTETHTYEVLPTMNVPYKDGFPGRHRTKRSNNDDDSEILED